VLGVNYEVIILGLGFGVYGENHACLAFTFLSTEEEEGCCDIGDREINEGTHVLAQDLLEARIENAVRNTRRR
jgi:hypothetical protein